ncbi:MAG: thiaminase II [Gaiellales bacterium]
MTLSDRCRADASAVWEGLHGHPFVQEMAAGTLPPEKFRFYIEQNLQYLAEYGRTMAIGVEKADDVATMRLFEADLANILHNEIPENEELLRRVLELGAEDRGGSRGMAPATIAYTGFLVSAALAGGPAEILAAVLPCTWSYGDIGSRLLAAGLVHDHPVYAEWIRFFSEEKFGRIVDTMKADFERLAADADPERMSTLFTTSVRLERGFWDMAYSCEHWPDM